MVFAITGLAGIVPTDGSLWVDGEHVGDSFVYLALAMIWIASLAAMGVYEAKTVGIGSEEYKRLGRGALTALATTTFIVFTFRLDLNRAFIFVAVTLATVVAGVLRQVVRKQLHRLRANGRYTRRVRSAGTWDTVSELVRHFRRAPFAGLHRGRRMRPR